MPSNLRLYLTYYGRHLDYSYITAGAPQAGDSVILSMNVTEPGFYYLRIHDQDNGFHADYTYTLTASFTEAADPQETNNTLLDAFTLTTDTVQGYLFPENDEEWYRVWVDAGQTLGVKVEDTPSNLRPHIALYDRNRRIVFAASYAENKGDNPPVLNHPFSKAGYV